MTHDTLLDFPCRFPIKAIGPKGADFQQLVYDLVKPHVPELTTNELSQNTSSSGNYLAVTVNIRAQSQAQVDAIYYDLTANDTVLMAL